MKTFIIATILSVGVLLRPQVAPSTNQAQPGNATVAAVSQEQVAIQPLERADMDTSVGGVVWNCSGEIDQNHTSVYYTCCVNLWIIKICVSVYLGEIPAPMGK